MIKFKKVLSTRLISLILVVVLSIPATAYGTDLSNRSNLRPPPATSSPAGRERLRETLSEVTYHEHVNKHINPQAEALYQDFLKSKGIASNPENIAL
nr:hypothetical protein [Candidatus Omnitrophota bacterium]